MRQRIPILCWTLVASLCTALSPAVAEDLGGSWQARAQGDEVAIELQVPALNAAQGAHIAFTVPAGELVAVAGADGPRAELRRDAGTFRFVGLSLAALPPRPARPSRQQDAAGELSFVPNPGFADEVRSLGVREVAPADLFYLAFHDVDTGYLRELAAAGVDASGPRDLHELAVLKFHGVTAAYLRGLADAGLRRLSVHQLSMLRMHGVDGEAVRRMEAQAGHQLSVDELLHQAMHDGMHDGMHDMMGHDMLGMDPMDPMHPIAPIPPHSHG